MQATGQSPNTELLATLAPSSSSPGSELVNPRNGFVRVRPTMQFADPAYPHLFAVGDVADSGAHKAARPAAQQAVAAARNIAALVDGRAPTEAIVVEPAAIHLTLGLVRFSSTFTSTKGLYLSFVSMLTFLSIAGQTKNVIFRNPNLKEGATEPFVNLKDE